MTAEDKIREAKEARDELASALKRAGIQFPAMDVQPKGQSNGKPTHGFVQLGEVSAPVAMALAFAISRGARS